MTTSANHSIMMHPTTPTISHVTIADPLPGHNAPHIMYRTLSHVSGDTGPGVVYPGMRLSRALTPGGTPVDTSQPALPNYHRALGDPASIGFISLSAGTLLISLYNVQTRGITTPSVILGLALGFSSIVQTIAGILEWASGNTFAAIAFTSYGGFWFSFAVLYIPQFEVTASYASDISMLANGIGPYLVMWGIITFLFLLASLRSSIALISLFLMLDLSFWLTAAGYLSQNEKILKGGGGFGIAAAFCGFYAALATLLSGHTSFFLVPTGDLRPELPHKRA
ncbi:membrane protein [Cryptococcus neoformans C23]|uniref:Membrane protein n=2 Tax=Cryptococcus neoformans TaxID=5207 RepID=A0A854QD42_CRYNE|nr:membrane protein [Cryptococcus neoformans var. grubii H99]AUB27449.1 membrane protein [Cryptococcus neoformans var. grubii]OWZ34136.1 membrane protein [Cryptococcus neoformans var. grubii AD1-83a]OWZ40350.1 membrane protein [Cryptococcus neoformans var. grubii C23]OWZ51251.1 membrane protein [Cryptococcus neoformans var. grubii 125.91]OXG13684.1 membrane protein [Cryptococcus neoformans var. grubii Tu259-1]OXG28005.1 membrane protein [Cryptococcus neoformans var. grubii Bt15]OXG35531.1 me|eukprot:XP_012051956.1 membrane protein [Cryptococcus neoformans var. grubii H99]